MTRQLTPTTWPDAVEALRRHGDDVVVVAGGTSAQPVLTTRTAPPAALLHLSGLPGVAEVVVRDRRMRVGAMVAVADERLARLRPSQGFGWFATPAVRGRATLVGNLASPHGPRELVPLVLACGGMLDLVAADGARVRVRPDAGPVPPGALAEALEVTVPERVAHARQAARARSSRAEIAVAAARGTGAGVVVSLGVPTADRAARVVVVPVPEALLADPAAGRALAAEVRAATASVGASDAVLDVVAGLAARVHRDLHAPEREEVVS